MDNKHASIRKDNFVRKICASERNIMQFQLATDYAIRILHYLYENEGTLTTAVDMSEKLGVTYLYFMKVIGKLKKAGMVESVQGCNGGYRLGTNGGDISFYDIVMVMEDGIAINRCLQPDQFCSRDAAPGCPVHQYYGELQDVIIAMLKKKTIAGIAPK